jgi:hypothetical protein
LRRAVHRQGSHRHIGGPGSDWASQRQRQSKRAGEQQARCTAKIRHETKPPQVHRKYVKTLAGIAWARNIYMRGVMVVDAASAAWLAPVRGSIPAQQRHQFALHLHPVGREQLRLVT